VVHVAHQPRLSDRDRLIIALARRRLRGGRIELDEALRALREAVAEIIPAGRVYVLGATALGPIVGSIISGLGIADGEHGVQLVRVRGGRHSWLGRFA
jgi:hypothetical protein